MDCKEAECKKEVRSCSECGAHGVNFECAECEKRKCLFWLPEWEEVCRCGERRKVKTGRAAKEYSAGCRVKVPTEECWNKGYAVEVYEALRATREYPPTNVQSADPDWKVIQM